MSELLVEWTLLRQQDYLKKCLGLDIKRKLFQQYSTEYGRIDFAHEISGGKVAVTELETIVDNRAKLEYCQNQTLEYQKVRFQSDEKPLLIILVADETPQVFKRDLSEFASANHILLKFYSLAVVRNCYKRLIEGENAKRVARGFTNSTDWSADRTPYADLRTLRKVKNRKHLQQLCEEMGLGTMEKPIFSEEDSWVW